MDNYACWAKAVILAEPHICTRTLVPDRPGASTPVYGALSRLLY